MLTSRVLSFFALATVMLLSSMAIGCLPYLYKDRAPALISGIDIDQSLDVAQLDLENPKATSVLGIWALRDQPITPAQAARIDELYLRSIERIDNENMRRRDFAVWHFTWAISNLYRFGNDQVKAALQPAYTDAVARAKKLDKRVVNKLVLGDAIYSGPAHGGGKAYSHKHLVVPGNDDYLQSYQEYLESQDK
jgi:hypothetical protein